MSKKKKKPLTFDKLIEYHQKILIPDLEDRLVNKKEFNEFKDKIYTDIDAMLKKLDILIEDKEIRKYQEEKEKKLFAIMIKAMKEHSILSQKELEEIAHLDIF